tara:strand:+ start:2482 stop:2958 length:477 start_codon:yes stop_codon:yes gene_type:complete
MFKARYISLVGLSALAIATPIVADFEGLETKAYLDAVQVPTICYGSTQGVYIGQEKTKEQCEALLQKELGYFMAQVDKAVKIEMPKTRLAALSSFAYNVGMGNFKRSTLLRKLNSGDVVGACNELPRWVYAKGKKLRGLERRREAERELCLMGAQSDV